MVEFREFREYNEFKNYYRWNLRKTFPKNAKLAKFLNLSNLFSGKRELCFFVIPPN